MIEVDGRACIGCTACSSVCPSGLIKIHDSDTREIRFASCREDCRLCVDICPENAISICEEGHDQIVQLPFAVCMACGSRFATARMLDRVRSSLQAFEEAKSWIDLCLVCRRLKSAESAAISIVRRRN